MNKFVITSGNISLQAELNESPTAQKIGEALPFVGRANTWGDEIYFEIPVEMEGEPDARAQVEVGELGYWQMGKAFCIFFGPTPVSRDERPRAYSPVNIIGRVLGDARLFREVKNGDKVQLSHANRTEE